MRQSNPRRFFPHCPNPYRGAFLLLIPLLAVLVALPGATTLLAAPRDFLKQHNLKVVSLKFFEGLDAAPKYGARSYQGKFPQASTRHIFWELKLEAAGKRPAPVPFTIETLWYDPAGKLMKQASETFTLDATKKRLWYTHAYGYPRPGHWQPGKYRVALRINGQEVASGAFEITPSPKPPRGKK